MTVRTSDLLAIGEAAILLRFTRQRVLDLCARGLLPYVLVGSQRRVRRADVEALIEPSMSRDELEQLWLHQAIAGKYIANAPAVIAAAEINLRRLRRLHPDGPEEAWLDRWEALLAGDTKPVIDALTSPSHHAIQLRSTSPFAGVLSEVERRHVLAALAEHRRDQARPMRLDTLERVMRAV